MFGLSVEKLLVIGLVTALILGPRRLPLYAGRLAGWVRRLRAFVEASRARTEDELGVPLRSSEWQAEWRRYDPRRIVRDALADVPVAVSMTQVLPSVPPPSADNARPDDGAEPASGAELASGAEPAENVGPDVAVDVVLAGPGAAASAARTGAAVSEGSGSAASSGPLTRQRWVVAGGTSGHPRRVLITEPVPDAEPSAAPEAEPTATAGVPVTDSGAAASPAPPARVTPVDPLTRVAPVVPATVVETPDSRHLADELRSLRADVKRLEQQLELLRRGSDADGRPVRAGST